MEREIVKFGSRMLRQRCAPVAQVDSQIKALVKDLYDSMRAAEGVGLAAPQIGMLHRVIVVDVSEHAPTSPPIALINPQIVAREGREVAEEGCLSLPDLYGEVPRATRIQVESLDMDNKPFSFAATDFYARALQHEIDHLDGKLFIDYISPLKRQLMRGALKRLKREGEAWDRANC